MFLRLSLLLHRPRMPKAIWFINPEDREAIENALKYSPAFKRLREIVRMRLDGIITKQFNLETYKNLDWSNTQAHINGQLQEDYFLLDLIGDTT